MKTFFSGLLLTATVLASCNNNKQASTVGDSTKVENPPAEKQSASVNGVKAIIDSYLDLKNALAKDDDKGAAASAEEIGKAIAAFDKSALTADQSKAYLEIEGDAKEHAEHIAKNAGNIEHQREHFESLSEDVHDLVNTFGGGQPLYLLHCPMYNKNKGANWISETKTIQNPYLGKAMSTCGTVKEDLKM